MNFKTNILLLVLLAVAGVVYFLSGGGTKPAQQTIVQPGDHAGEGAKLLDIQPDSVVRLSIVKSDGQRAILEKNKGKWNLLEPVKSRAVGWAVDTLISQLTDLTSNGRPVAPSTAETGLDKPRIIVQIDTQDGKGIKLAIGNKTTVGDLMYVQIDGQDVNLTSSTVDPLFKNPGVDLRDKHLADIQQEDVQQIELTQPASHVLLAREAEGWKMIDPSGIPADKSVATMLLTNLVNAEASELLASDADELAFARFDHPTLIIRCSAQQPSTRPATQTATQSSAPPDITITIGAPDSLVKDHYFVKMSDGRFGKIPSDSLEMLKKTALDLRDRDLFHMPVADVTRVSIVKQTYPPLPPGVSATRPSNVTPVSSHETVLIRNIVKSTLGPSMPTSVPSSQPVAKPVPVWQIVGDTAALDESKVNELLARFDPFHAELFIAEAPPYALANTYVIELTTPSGSQKVILYRPAGGLRPYGTYNGLTFDIPSEFLDALDADLHKTDLPMGAMN